MYDTVTLIVRPYPISSMTPEDPAHWVVMLKFADGRVMEFKRGGLLTEEDGVAWAETLVDDYFDVVEIEVRELERCGYKARLAELKG